MHLCNREKRVETDSDSSNDYDEDDDDDDGGKTLIIYAYSLRDARKQQ